MQRTLISPRWGVSGAPSAMGGPSVRAVIYLRISDDREGRGVGVDRQREDCEALCRRRRWKVLEVFEDNDTRATDGKVRPRYSALQDRVADGDVDVVVAYETTRLWRD